MIEIVYRNFVFGLKWADMIEEHCYQYQIQRKIGKKYINKSEQKLQN